MHPSPQDSPTPNSPLAVTAPGQQAACPACRAPVEGIWDALPPTITLAVFAVCCPRCDASWTEGRRGGWRGQLTETGEPRWYNAEGNFLPPREEARRRKRAAALRVPDLAPAAAPA